MRLARVSTNGGSALAYQDGDSWRVLDREEFRPETLFYHGHRALARAVEFGASEPLHEFRALAPLSPRKIVAIGLNYEDHLVETGLERPNAPLVFAKFPSSVCGPGDPIVIDPAVTGRVDWEVELAVVIGSRIRRASPASALEHVLGYTAANDVSARDVQFADGQWVRGKSLDSFCPLGPVIATPDEVGDPQALRLTTRVNGKTVQDSCTDQMIFGVAELLSYCSQSFTFEPGDVLLTGTPWGCGEFMEPRRSLQPGDQVEVEVEKIGTLANPVTTA